MNVKTYDLENTGRGYEPRYEMVESTGRGDEPDGLGDWVRKEDYDTAEFFHNRYRVESEKSHERKDIQIDALQAELAAVKAERDRIQQSHDYWDKKHDGLKARVAQLEAALQPFLLKPPQTNQVDILSRPQPVWWDCICGISNSLDTCGNCHRSRLD